MNTGEWTAQHEQSFLDSAFDEAYFDSVVNLEEVQKCNSISVTVGVARFSSAVS